jgi:hypothetical protein
MKITKTGIYNLKSSEYHANPCDGFSVTRSFLCDVIKRSPMHAMHGSAYADESADVEVDSKAARIGKAMHGLALGTFNEEFVLVDAPDFRTKAARELRDDAAGNGFTAILAHELQDAELAIAELSKFHTFNGENERTYVWDRDGILCRAMLDSVTADGWIEDYKTTMGSAEPNSWCRNQLFAGSLEMQAAWYIEAYEAVTGKPAKGFRFIVQEQKAPYAVSRIVCDIETVRLGQSKINKAFNIVKECVGAMAWPGYQDCVVTPPPYIIQQWEEQNGNTL